MTRPTSGTHTPGPWRVGDAGHTVFGPPNGQPSPETIASGIKRSNASLIAQAPAMYAALQAIVAKNVRLRPEAEFETPGDWIIITTSAFDTARAILRTIEGT